MNAEDVLVYMGMMQEVTARSFGKKSLKMCFYSPVYVCVCIPLHAYIPPIEIFTLVFEQAVINFFFALIINLVRNYCI